MRLTGNGLCKQRLAGAGRADKQGALRQLCADRRILLRVVQEVDDLDEGFLRLVLACHIGKGHAGVALNIFLGGGLADVSDHAAARADSSPDKPEHHPHKNEGQDVIEKEGHDGTGRAVVHHDDDDVVL